MTGFLDQCKPDDLKRLSALLAGYAARRMRQAELVAGLVRVNPDRFGTEDAQSEIDEGNVLTFVSGVLADLAEQKETPS